MPSPPRAFCSLLKQETGHPGRSCCRLHPRIFVLATTGLGAKAGAAPPPTCWLLDVWAPWDLPGPQTQARLWPLAPSQPRRKGTLTCFIRSKSKASRATSFTLPAGFILGGGGRQGAVRRAAGPCGYPPPLPTALQRLPFTSGRSSATWKGLSRLSPPQQGLTETDRIAQPKSQALGASDLTARSASREC